MRTVMLVAGAFVAGLAASVANRREADGMCTEFELPFGLSVVMFVVLVIGGAYLCEELLGEPPCRPAWSVQTMRDVEASEAKYQAGRSGNLPQDQACDGVRPLATDDQLPAAMEFLPGEVVLILDPLTQ